VQGPGRTAGGKGSASAFHTSLPVIVLVLVSSAKWRQAVCFAMVHLLVLLMATFT
jgi:hypothetical protein